MAGQSGIIAQDPDEVTGSNPSLTTQLFFCNDVIAQWGESGEGLQTECKRE